MRWFILVLFFISSFLYSVRPGLHQVQTAKAKKAFVALEWRARQAVYNPAQAQLDDLETSFPGYNTLVTLLTPTEQQQLDELVQGLQLAVSQFLARSAPKAAVGAAFAQLSSFIKSQLKQLGAVAKTRPRTQARAPHHDVMLNYYARKPGSQPTAVLPALKQERQPIVVDRTKRTPSSHVGSVEPVDLNLLEKRLRTVLQDEQSTTKQFHRNLALWVLARVKNPNQLVSWVAQHPVEGAVVVGAIYLFEKRGYPWSKQAAQFMQVVRQNNLLHNVIKPASAKIKKQSSWWGTVKKWFAG